MAKLFRSRIQNLDLDEQEIIAMLISVDFKTSDGMVSCFVETYFGSFRFENMVHKMAALLVYGCRREPSQLKILFSLLKKAKLLSDSIIILLLSTMVCIPSLKAVVWKDLLCLGLNDPRRTLLSFISEIGTVKRKSFPPNIKRKFRDWLNSWKNHFDRNVCATIEAVNSEKTNAFQIESFLLKKIELISEEKYLRQSQLLGLEFNDLPTNTDFRNKFTKGRLVEEKFSNVVVTLLMDVLEDARFQLKSIEILNYFVEMVGNDSCGLKSRVNGKVDDAFDKYGPNSFPCFTEFNEMMK